MANQSQSSGSAPRTAHATTNQPAIYNSPVTYSGQESYNGPVVFNASVTINTPVDFNGPVVFRSVVTNEEPAIYTRGRTTFNGPVVFNETATLRGPVAYNGPVVFSNGQVVNRPSHQRGRQPNSTSEASRAAGVGETQGTGPQPSDANPYPPDTKSEESPGPFIKREPRPY